MITKYLAWKTEIWYRNQGLFSWILEKYGIRMIYSRSGSGDICFMILDYLPESRKFGPISQNLYLCLEINISEGADLQQYFLKVLVHERRPADPDLLDRSVLFRAFFDFVIDEIPIPAWLLNFLFLFAYSKEELESVEVSSFLEPLEGFNECETARVLAALEAGVEVEPEILVESTFSRNDLQL